MSGIGSFFSGLFGGGGGGGVPTIGTDIAPQAPGGVFGTVPTGVISAIDPVAGATAASSAPLWQKLLLGGMLGAGEVGNLLQTNKSNSYTDFLTNLMKNPAQLSGMVNQATTPLSSALVAALNNRVQGDLAQRGLAQAPGIFATSELQALAPYQLQEQQLAQNQVLAALGLPGQVTNINQPPQNLSPLMAGFLRTFQNPSIYTPSQPQQPQQPTPLVPQQTTQAPGFTWPDITGGWGSPVIPTQGS